MEKKYSVPPFLEFVGPAVSGGLDYGETTWRERGFTAEPLRRSRRQLKNPQGGGGGGTKPEHAARDLAIRPPPGGGVFTLH
jgi:hypothetical protein